MKSKRIAIKPYRSNLRWAELLLGESLQSAFVAPGYGATRPQRDASLIPLGEFCYDFTAMRHGAYVPCPYFKYTGHGSVKCIYLGVEASDGISRKLAKHFGSRAKVQAAGVIDTWSLPDSNKECGVSLLFPSYLKYLQDSIEDYEQAIFGKRRDTVHHFFYLSGWDNAQQLDAVAQIRLTIWQHLCSMVEDVPKALITRLMLIDAMLRGHSEKGDVLMNASYEDDIQGFTSPQSQFWYLYRMNFMDVGQFRRDVVWLEDRQRISELYYYDQRVAAIIALRESRHGQSN
jgi:hypothetical protein